MTTSRRRAALSLPFSLLLLSACSSDDGGGSAAPTATVAAPTVTATAPASTSTATAAPATSTAAPPSATATSAPATATATSTVTDTPQASPTDEATATPSSTPLPAGAVALFRADALDPANPFPSNRLLDETGHVHVTGALIGADLPPDAKYDPVRNAADLTAPQFSRLTGFSTYAPVRIKFPGPVVAPETGGAYLVDCERGAAPIRLETTTIETSGDFALEIYPVLPLLPKTTYVYVVTRDVLDADGKNISPAAEFTQALAGEIEALAEWRQELDCALDRLADEAGLELEHIAVADVFTTQATTDELLAIKDLFVNGMLPAAEPAFDDSPLTQIATGIFDEGTPEFQAVVGTANSETIARVAVGSFPSYDFRTGGIFDPAFVSGSAVPTRINDLEFYMSIPKAPAPEGGYPLVIFGHGLGGSARNAIDVLPIFDGAPLATIGISSVQHGLRGNVANFFNLTNGFVTRDNFRQTVADLLQLRRMIENASEPPFDVIDKSRVHYMGISLGGIMGTLFMGYDPDVQVGMLSVPGGGLPNIVNSPAIGDLLKPLIALTYQIQLSDPNFPAFLHRFNQLAQWSLDAGDPINTAPVILDPERALPGVPTKRILVHEGVVDTVVPNETTDALALAMGLPNANTTRGCLLPAGCSGIWRFVMADYGFNAESGHGVTGTVPQAMQQATQFLLSDGTQIVNAEP